MPTTHPTSRMRRSGLAAASTIIALGATLIGPQDSAARADAATSAPQIAQSAGFTTPVLSEDFNSTNGIDLTGTGQADKNFYLDRPYAQPLPASDVKVSNGALTLTQSTETANVGLSSMSSRTGKGKAFQYGYFEVRMKFDENNSYHSKGFPSFWMVPSQTVYGSEQLNKYSELDIFEAFHAENAAPYHWFVGSVHDWTRTPRTHVMNQGNNIHKLSSAVDFNQYHTFSMLWTKGHITWYLDGQQMMTQSYGAGQVPSPNPYGTLPSGAFSSLDSNTKGMVLILGTGVNYPMQIDYVRVWH